MHSDSPDLDALLQKLDATYGSPNGDERVYVCFEHILRQLMNLDATDAKDKFYACLGIVGRLKRGVNTELPSPDYSKSIKTIYIDAI